MKQNTMQELTDEKEILLNGKKRALRLLERKDYSRKELTDKLLKDGYSEELVNKIIEYTNKDDEKKVLAENKLFATLNTSVRNIKFDGVEFLLTDTIGFVSKLPHHLVESFKSTLEEIKEADLILHVVDASNEHYEEQIQTTNDVLEALGVKDIPIFYVFNK